MAIVKHSQTKSPAVAVHDVICISDDDSDDSDEACEFENVVVDQRADIGGFTESRFEEIVDERANDDETTLDEVSGETTSHSGVTYSLPPEERGAQEREDEGIATDWEWDLPDDEGPRTEPADPAREDSHAPDVLDPEHASLRDIVVELGTLRDRVAQLEAWQHSHVACEARSLSKKRIRTTSTGPRAKRRKNNTIVNLSATKAYVKWDDTSERCLYTWKRGHGGHCWVSATEGEAHEEVDGEYLLCCTTAMSVELRANADWLPIEVRYNEDKEVFEGYASVGSRRLEVTGSVMMDMMCGSKVAHAASVFA